MNFTIPLATIFLFVANKTCISYPVHSHHSIFIHGWSQFQSSLLYRNCAHNISNDPPSRNTLGYCGFGGRQFTDWRRTQYTAQRWMLNWCLLEFITTLGYIHYCSGTIRLLRTVLIAADLGQNTRIHIHLSDASGHVRRCSLTFVLTLVLCKVQWCTAGPGTSPLTSARKPQHLSINHLAHQICARAKYNFEEHRRWQLL